MTLSIKHKFTSAKTDGTDATLIRPSNWNDEHDLECSADKVLGRATAGTGAVEELSAPSFGRSLLACSTAAQLLTLLGAGVFVTGDVKLTLQPTASDGWVLMNDGTIGSSASTASTRANDDTEALFVLLWENVSDTYAPVTGGRGVSAAADWAANKKIALTKVLGRTLGVAGAGSGLTSRALGVTAGAETHTLTLPEMAEHDHGGETAVEGQHTHPYRDRYFAEATVATYREQMPNSGNYNGRLGSAATDADNTYFLYYDTNTSAGEEHKHDIAAAGGGEAHNNMQPTTFFNAMIKL